MRPFYYQTTFAVPLRVALSATSPRCHHTRANAPLWSIRYYRSRTHTSHCEERSNLTKHKPPPTSLRRTKQPHITQIITNTTRVSLRGTKQPHATQTTTPVIARNEATLRNTNHHTSHCEERSKPTQHKPPPTRVIARNEASLRNKYQKGIKHLQRLLHQTHYIFQVGGIFYN